MPSIDPDAMDNSVDVIIREHCKEIVDGHLKLSQLEEKYPKDGAHLSHKKNVSEIISDLLFGPITMVFGVCIVGFVGFKFMNLKTYGRAVAKLQNTCLKAKDSGSAGGQAPPAAAQGVKTKPSDSAARALSDANPAASKAPSA